MSSNNKEELAKKIDNALHLHNVNVNAEFNPDGSLKIAPSFNLC
jgi:hypothetical protein